MTQLRVARPEDLSQIARLEVEIFGANAWSKDAVVSENLAELSPTRHLLVSTDDEAVVGYGMLMCTGDVADILRIAVKPVHRRQGRATALLGSLVDFACAQGYRRVLLEVAAGNSAALHFYTAQGFVEVGRRRRYYVDDVDALVLQWPL